MFAEERQQQIAGLVAASGRASVTDLAERFRITTETVRRDLAALEAAGTVRRVHGGAVSADRFSTTEESILERTVQRQSQKLRIAEAALAHTVLNAVEAAYRRTDFFDKRRELMQAWGCFATGQDDEPPA